MHASPEQSADDLAAAFAMLGDWEARYTFVIDLGRKLPKLDPSFKTEQHRVHGCQATVWLVPRVESNGQVLIHFDAESDAAIVTGLIAILKKLYDGRTPQQIVSFDIEGFLQRVGLEEHLSPTRRNGLHHMVKRIRAIAEAAVNAGVN
jgi:sulfur transfer protein SufE